MSGRVLRVGGAVALLVAGLVHLDLYFGGYRDAGSVPSFGRSILLNAIVSAVLAVLIAARREWYVRVAGIVVAAASIAAFAYTHTHHTLFGFQGDGFNPSPQAQIVLIAEIATIVLLAATFIPSIAKQDESWGTPFLGAATGVAAAAMAVLGVYSADENESTTTADGPAAVSIADFTFSPQELTVPRGTTVTWTNNDSFSHSVIGGDGSFTSELLDSDGTFRFTFDEPGRYSFTCGLHPQMTGVITVTD